MQIAQDFQVTHPLGLETQGGSSNIFLSCLFATSMFVFFEPAPFDLAALLICTAAILNKRFRIDYVPGLCGLVFLFLVARSFTLLFPEQIGSPLRFFGITTYLSIATCVLAGFIATRGPKCVEPIIYGLYLGTAVTFIAYLCVKVGIEVGSDITMAYERSRFRGFFKDPNVLGPALVPVFICALGGLLSSAKSVKLVHLAVLLMSAIMIVASLSRGAWLSLIVALGVFTLGAAAALKFRYLLSLVVSITVVGVVTVAIVSFSGALPDLGESVLERIEEKRYDQDRFAVQAHLLDLALQHFWGYGPGEANRFAERLNAEESNAAHNTYIRLLFENGYLGLAVFMLLVVASILVGAKTLRCRGESVLYCSCGLAVVVSVAANAFFVDTLHWRHFWIFVAIIWGLSAWQRKTSLYATNVDICFSREPQVSAGGLS